MTNKQRKNKEAKLKSMPPSSLIANILKLEEKNEKLDKKNKEQKRIISELQDELLDTSEKLDLLLSLHPMCEDTLREHGLLGEKDEYESEDDEDEGDE